MKVNIRVLTIIFLMLAWSSSDAQSRKEKKRYRAFIKEAIVCFDNDDYSGAWKNYHAAMRIDNRDQRAAINAAVSLNVLRYPIDSFNILIPALENSALSEAKYQLAMIRHRQHRLDDAIAILDKQLKVSEKKRTISTADLTKVRNYCVYAKQYMEHPHRSVISNMGPSINSKYDDYVPVLMPDESALYFTSKRQGTTGDKMNGDNKYFEDIYVTYFSNGEWKPAENVGYPLNSETNDGCVAISPDGQRMIIYRTAADVTSGDLYVSTMIRENKWGPLEKYSTEINSKYVETSACFSNDTSEIFFSSDRPGGYGGKDIYRIKKLPNGAWSLPMNLGPNVNTPEDEDAPFLHPDGVTLYYSSRGHNSMGDYDVFRSIWDEDSLSFLPSENLGYPINDVEGDIFFVLNVSGKKGYYSSEKSNTLGGTDIYEIDTRFGDNDMAVRTGYIYLHNGPARVRMVLFDKETGNVDGVYQSNPETGRFILIMNPLKSYTLVAEEEGYKAQTIELSPMVMDKADKTIWITLKRLEDK